MWQAAKNARVKFGGDYFIRTPHLVLYNMQPFLKIEISEGTFYMGVSSQIYNKDREKVATINRNQIYCDKGQKDTYKIEGNADRFTLLEKETSEVLIDIKIRREAKPMDIEIAMRMYLPNGMLIEATANSITFPNNIRLSNNLWEGCWCGMNINPDGTIMIGGLGPPPPHLR